MCSFWICFVVKMRCSNCIPFYKQTIRMKSFAFRDKISIGLIVCKYGYEFIFIMQTNNKGSQICWSTGLVLFCFVISFILCFNHRHSFVVYSFPLKYGTLFKYQRTTNAKILKQNMKITGAYIYDTF